ncbi:hypothetical protein pb186bvf_004978 [Paramecium bursaria]
MGLCIQTVCPPQEQNDLAQHNRSLNISLQQEPDALQYTDFQILNLLGQGAHGKVVLVRHKKTQNLYALKMVSKSLLRANQQEKYLESEKMILQQVKHPFIIKLYFSFQTKDKLFLGTEFINGGELFTHLRRAYQFSEDRTRFYAAEILLAIKCLHENGIIYRDLKPENILIDQTGHIKLTDFGLSKMKFHEITGTIAGTPEYVAPEVLNEEGYNQSVDWYSLGVLIYEMLSGAPPFYQKDKYEILRIKLEREPDMQPYFSQNAKSLLTGLLKMEVYINNQQAGQRLGSNGAYEIMLHPFFQSIDWDLLQKRQIEPPFKPALNGQLDLQNFDPQFTQQQVLDDTINDKTQFSYIYEKFTYVYDQIKCQQEYE